MEDKKDYLLGSMKPVLESQRDVKKDQYILMEFAAMLDYCGYREAIEILKDIVQKTIRNGKGYDRL